LVNIRVGEKVVKTRSVNVCFIFRIVVSVSMVVVHGMHPTGLVLLEPARMDEDKVLHEYLHQGE
jgi:hypothetical protein